MVAGAAGVHARPPVAAAPTPVPALALHQPMVARHVRDLAHKAATPMVAQ
jgi:hypothetical protein